MTVQNGDYGLIRTSDLFGGLIRLVTQSSVNHAFIVANDSIVEMQPSGVCISPEAEYDNIIWVHVPMDDAQRARVVTAAGVLVSRHTGYSFRDIAAQLAYRTLHVRPKWLARFIRSTKSMVCSQSVDWCFQQAEVQLFDDERLPGLVSPGDLLAVAQENGWIQ